MALRGKVVGILHCADIEVYFSRKPVSFVTDRRAAIFAKSPPNPWRGTIERPGSVGKINFFHRIPDESYYCATGVASTTLAMTVGHPQRIALRGKLRITTQTASTR